MSKDIVEVTPQLISVLKNFSTINQGIRFEEGNNLKTRNISGSFFARAVLGVEIPKEFFISDLPNFISMLSLYDKPILELKEDHLIIKNKTGNTKTTYRYGAQEVIVFPEKFPTMKDADFEFQLSEEQFTSMMKAAAIINSEFLSVVGEKNGNAQIMTSDLTNSLSNQFSITISEDAPANFQFVMHVDKLHLVKDSYVIEMSKKGKARFMCEENAIEYFVALDRKHTSFEE